MLMSKDLLTIGQAAEYLNVSQDTLRRWDASGKLSSVRSAGGHRYYPRSTLERFREELYRIATLWASSGIAPEIASSDLSETQDRFKARLQRMAAAINKNPDLSEQAALVPSIAGEIGNNSFDHNIGNWPDEPGVFFAYDLNKREVVLADRGVGIRRTLSRVRDGIESDTQALDIAMTEVISGRSSEHRGNGLKYVREVAMQYPIGVTLQSGSAIATINKDGQKDLQINPADQNIRGVLARIEY
jgi:excisionase family DNA binding protein